MAPTQNLHRPVCPHPASRGLCPCSGWKDAVTRAQWSHSTEHSGHPVRSTPPERTRHVLAGHLLRSGPTHNHWHATQNSLTILEPVHTRSGLKCCRDGFLPTGTHTGQQLGCCALGPPCLAQARPRPMKGHINFSGSGLNDRVMASEPMTMGWNVQPCPLPLLIFFFFYSFLWLCWVFIALQAFLQLWQAGATL